MRGCWMILISMLLAAAPTQAQVVFDWALVSDAGNACDPQNNGCFGAVAENYRISKFETTNEQYAEFLNAIAATDTNALYNPNMGVPG